MPMIEPEFLRETVTLRLDQTPASVMEAWERKANMSKLELSMILLLRMMDYVVKRVGYGVPVANFEQAERLRKEARDMIALLQGRKTMRDLAEKHPQGYGLTLEGEAEVSDE